MNTMALFIGGVAPAVLLGVSTVLIRFATGAGASIPLFLLVVGVAIALTGGVALLITGDWAGSDKAIAFTIAMGLCWAAAVACMSYGLGTLKMPVSVVAPLSTQARSSRWRWARGSSANGTVSIRFMSSVGRRSSAPARPSCRWRNRKPAARIALAGLKARLRE